MRLSLAATAAAALVARVAATGEETTEVVTAYTTYCPEPTTISHGSQTHVVTEPTYVTFTSCPVSTPMVTETITECNDCPPAGPTAPPAYPTPPLNPTGGPQPPGSSTPLYPSGQPTPSQPSTSVPPPEYTGAASRAMAGAGAGLAGVLGVAAFVL